MNMNKASKITVGLIAIVAIGALIWSIISSNGMLEPEQETNVTAIKGEIACLPLKDGTAPPTTDCALGLRNDRGMFLELKGTPLSSLAAGEKVELTGPVTPIQPKSKYNSVGTMEIQKVSSL